RCGRDGGRDRGHHARGAGARLRSARLHSFSGCVRRTMAQEKITIAIMGMDQHENGAVAVVRTLREAQMQVNYLGRFQTPQSVAEAAAREGAAVVGVSCHSWEYLVLVPRLLDELARRGLDIPVVIGGSVITADD